MKQVININFQGRVVPIEVSAYEILKSYIDSLSRHFAGEDGRDEIINDIESRIGELFQERISKGSTCITDEDVNAIIRSMGRPEDFETEESSSAGNTESGNQSSDSSRNSQSSFAYDNNMPKRLYRDENHKVLGGVCSGIANYFGIDMVVVRILFVLLSGILFVPYIVLWIAVPSTSSIQIGGLRKRMYRDPEEKYIGGVCSGLAHYFGINVWIPRVLFLLPFLSFVRHWSDWGSFNSFPNFVSFGFSPGAFIIYVILWLVLPEANSTAEKLEMKGEKVDMNSIKNSVVEEMKGVQQRAQKFGKEASAFASQAGRTFGTEATGAARRGSRSLGDIIIFIIKLFGYIILGGICVTLIVLLFTFGIWAIGYFPLKDYLLTAGWQNALAWGTLIFFVITPMVGVITWIIRKLARVRKGSKMLRISFILLWIAGWFCVTFLLASLSRDFKTSSNINEQEIILSNPKLKSLEITTVVPGQKFVRNKWFAMSAFEGAEDDTVFIRNVSVHIIKSPTDSFKVTMMKLACGARKNYADTAASLIQFNAVQKDSTLIIDKAIAINKKDKFRNQRIIITVYVPEGARIKVNDNVGWSHDVKFDGPWSTDWESVEFQGLENGWDEGRWYTMKNDGLYGDDGLPADSYKRDEIERRNRKNNDDDNDGNGDQNSNGKSGGGTYRYDSGANAKPTAVDSLMQKQEEEKRRTKDSLQKAKDKINKELDRLGGAKDGVTAWNNYPIPGHDPLLLLN